MSALVIGEVVETPNGPGVFEGAFYDPPAAFRVVRHNRASFPREHISKLICLRITDIFFYALYAREAVKRPAGNSLPRIAQT